MLYIKTNMDFSMNALLPKYTILCMFSHISKRNISELFDKLVDTPTFTQFLEHMKDKTAKQSCIEFVKNTIYTSYDDQAKTILKDEDLKNTFTDSSLTKEQRIKLFIAKASMKILFNGDTVPPEAYQIPFIKQMIQGFNDMIMEIDGVIETNSPIELYHLIVNHHATQLVSQFHNSVDILNTNDLEDDIPVYDSCLDLINDFNNVFDYESTFTIDKRPRSDIQKDETNGSRRNPKRTKK